MIDHNVTKIELRDGMLGVEYTVSPLDASPEQCFVWRSDQPHEDFKKAWAPLYAMAKQFIEIPLQIGGENLSVAIKKVKFLQSSKLGDGVCMTVEIKDLPHACDSIKITTPKYYVELKDHKIDKNGKTVECQALTAEQYAALKTLQEEAFKYAYYQKREQPTVEEAQEAAENGGFKDELAESSAVIKLPFRGEAEDET